LTNHFKTSPIPSFSRGRESMTSGKYLTQLSFKCYFDSQPAYLLLKQLLNI
jgi:hypothetical protein